MREKSELYLAAVLSADGLLLLTVLIKLRSPTNKGKGLNMEMSDGGRVARIVDYDLCFCFDYLPELCRNSSSSRAEAGTRSCERMAYESTEPGLVSAHTVHITQIDLNPSSQILKLFILLISNATLRR